MVYNHCGKTLTIPDKEIANSMKMLELSENEAIQMWLEDNGYELNEEQEELDEKAKKVKIKMGAKAEKSENKPKKPRTVIVSDEKVEIFQKIVDFLEENYEISVEKPNKLVKIYKNGKEFKLDLVETRQKK